MSQPVLYLLNQLGLFREELYQSCLIAYMQFPFVSLWFYDIELEYFEKKEKICAEFASTFQIRIPKKQKNFNNPSTKQARLS